MSVTQQVISFLWTNNWCTMVSMDLPIKIILLRVICHVSLFLLPLLGVADPASIMYESSSRCQPYDSNWIHWLIHVHPLTAKSWWRQWGCCGSWSLPEMLAIEGVWTWCDCHCCSHCPSVSFSALCYVGFPCFSFSLTCCQIWNICNLIIWLHLNYWGWLKA